MAIILEGPDNSGKSTLAEKLHTATGWPIVHAGGPPQSEEEIRTRLINDLSLMQQRVIMDRSFILSDMIYAPILRRVNSFEPRKYVRMIQAMDMHEPNFALIFCDGPDRVLLDMSKHIRKPHETELHVAAMRRNKDQILQSYRAMFNWFSLFMDCMLVDPRIDTAVQGLIKDIKIHMLGEYNDSNN
jgi:adenylate kinase family enzyme